MSEKVMGRIRSMFDEIAEIPQIKRGLCWCRTCGAVQKVDGGRAELDALRADKERLDKALAEVLAYWPHQDTLDELDHPDVDRPAPITDTPNIKQLRRWRTALSTPPEESSHDAS